MLATTNVKLSEHWEGFRMSAESGLPFIAAVAGFGILLAVLAFAVQHKRPDYRGIVGTVAVVATLLTTISCVQIASTRQRPLTVAEPTSAKPTCVRQGTVPACNCVGQR
jgi:hypothetical protein